MDMQTIQEIHVIEKALIQERGIGTVNRFKIEFQTLTSENKLYEKLMGKANKKKITFQMESGTLRRNKREREIIIGAQTIESVDGKITTMQWNAKCKEKD